MRPFVNKCKNTTSNITEARNRLSSYIYIYIYIYIYMCVCVCVCVCVMLAKERYAEHKKLDRKTYIFK